MTDSDAEYGSDSIRADGGETGARSVDVTDRLTLAARFNAKHGTDLLGQTLKVQEEAGEVAEAALSAEGRLLFKDADDFDLGDELAQLIVTAYYAAELHDVVDIDERVNQQLQENLSRGSSDERPCYLCNTETPEEDLWKRPYGPEQNVNVYLCEDCAEGGDA